MPQGALVLGVHTSGPGLYGLPLTWHWTWGPFAEQSLGWGSCLSLRVIPRDSTNWDLLTIHSFSSRAHPNFHPERRVSQNITNWWTSTLWYSMGLAQLLLLFTVLSKGGSAAFVVPSDAVMPSGPMIQSIETLNKSSSRLCWESARGRAEPWSTLDSLW